MEVGTVEDTTDFQAFHSYYKLVDEGKAKPILCPFCEREFIITHFNGDLRLTCFACDTLITPGIDMISNVRAVVKEHNL